MQLRALINTRRGIWHLRPETVGHGERLLPRKRLGITLAVAMPPDELPSQPRKATWKRWIVVLAGVLAIALAVLFLKAPVPERVSVRFVTATNYHEVKILVFNITNGLPGRITYWAGVIKSKTPLDVYPGGIARDVEAEGALTFSLDAPEEDTDWRVMWYFVEPDLLQTRREKARATCYWFLTKHRMH